MTRESDILARFDEWLSQQRQKPWRNEIFATGERDLAVAFCLHKARSTVSDITAEELADALVSIAERICAELHLEETESRRLFRLEPGVSLSQLRDVALTEWSVQVIESVVLKMELPTLAGTLLGDLDRGYAWFKRPNTADFLSGKSALSFMLDQPSGVRDVHRYLMGQVWG